MDDTWAVVDTHTNRVGATLVHQVKDRTLITLNVHGAVHATKWNGSAIVQRLSACTDTLGGRTTTYLSPAQARAVIAALQAALAEAETVPENRKAVA